MFIKSKLTHCSVSILPMLILFCSNIASAETCTNSPVWLGGNRFAQSIQSAYDLVNADSTFYIEGTSRLAGPFSENLLLDRDIEINLLGGFPCDYGIPDDYTVVNGSITIASGSLTISDIVITTAPIDKASIQVSPTAADAGSTITVSVNPGPAGISGPLSVFASYSFDQTTGLPQGASVEMLDIGSDLRFTPLSFMYTVPTVWPSGSYFFCITSPQVTCRRLDVTNNAPLVDQGTCTAVSLAGPSDHKLDIVFLADNFTASDIATFRTKVDEYRTALLSVSPFAENSSKINFWKVERLGAVNTSYDIPSADFWRIMVSHCGGADLVAIIEGPAYYRPMDSFAINNSIPPWLMITTGNTGGMFLFRFGYAFANLDAEYPNTSIYLTDPGASLGPNTDVSFCPKWCSGKPNASATVSYGFSCWNAWQTFNTCMQNSGLGDASADAVQACWTEASDMHDGWQAGIDMCDFGTDCVAGTGCFWNAAATNRFRPTSVSIMSGGGDLATGFNFPSREAIRAILEQYN